MLVEGGAVFDWKLFALLVGVCLPGVAVTVPGTVRIIGALSERAAGDKTLPSRSVLVAVAIVQTSVLVAVGAVLGILTAPRAGLAAPFFESVASGTPAWEAAAFQLVGAGLVGGPGVVLFLALYYGWFRRRLDAVTLRALEGLRNGVGLWGRVLYGGIAEEVLTRWGLMSLLAWVFSLVLGGTGPLAMWAAIVVSGLLFGLGHAPSYLAAGCRRTPAFFATMLVLNLWASLVFGWLYWQYGLLSAMAAHALFHLLWWPIDVRQYRRLRQPEGMPEATREAQHGEVASR